MDLVKSCTFFATLLFLLAFPWSSSCAQVTPSLLKNGNFATWNDELPTDWAASVGATNGGDSPLSLIEKATDGSLQISGNLNTMAWRMLSQNFAVQPRTTFVLSFTARADDIRREANQYANCYIGVFLKNDRGQNVGQSIVAVSSPQYSNERMLLRAPPETVSAQVVVFLSQSGTLNIKEIGVRAARPDESFDLLISDMDRNYSFFSLRKIDWPALTARYRERATSATTNVEFSEVVAEMLAEMKDVHTWVEFENQKFAKFRSDFEPNYNFEIVRSHLKEISTIEGLGFTGRTADGFGYVCIQSLSGIGNQQLSSMSAAIRELFDSPGMIVDLRRNAGGAEPIAQFIAGMFTNEPVVYARHRFRSGPNHSDFSEPQARVLEPTSEQGAYTRPVVCLIGPGAVSSAEGFAMMFQALPHATTLGQPTRGASGNPQPVPLPNGVDVWYSRWVSLTPDGQAIETVGAQPRVPIEHEQRTDAAFAKAVEFLRNRSMNE